MRTYFRGALSPDRPNAPFALRTGVRVTAPVCCRPRLSGRAGIPPFAAFKDPRRATMQIEVSGHQIDVTPALRDYVQTKMQRIERHFDHVQTMHVILSVDKLEHRAEATLTTSGKALHADSSSENMYAAIDLLADKLDRQVIKHKEKVSDHHRGESAARQSTFG